MKLLNLSFILQTTSSGMRLPDIVAAAGSPDLTLQHNIQ